MFVILRELAQMDEKGHHTGNVVYNNKRKMYFPLSINMVGTSKTQISCKILSNTLTHALPVSYIHIGS